jgi:hypothetical protein
LPGESLYVVKQSEKAGGYAGFVKVIAGISKNRGDASKGNAQNAVDIAVFEFGGKGAVVDVWL